MSINTPVVDNSSDIVEHLFQITSKLAEVLPQTRVEPPTERMALSPEQFDSLTASW